jgi:hypothetical protein
MAIDSSYSSGLISEPGRENQPSEHNPPTNTSTNDIENSLRIASFPPAFSVASLLKTAAVSGSMAPPFPGILDDAAGAAVFTDLLSGEDLAVHVSEDLVGQKRYIFVLGATINLAEREKNIRRSYSMGGPSRTLRKIRSKKSRGIRNSVNQS